MKKSILLLIISLSVGNMLWSQEDTTKLGVYEIFIDGQWISSSGGTPPVSLDPERFNSAFISQVNYPSQARRMGIEGQTFITISIDQNGDTFDQQVLEHIGADTETELLSVLAILPEKWKPATFENENVISRIKILVLYKLDDVKSIKYRDSVYKCFVASALPSRTRNAADIKQKAKKKRVKKTK